MEIRLLGPVELLSQRGPVPIGSEKQRALLAFLALQPQRLVTNDALIDALWGDNPPDGTVKALRFHVSRLRAILRQADAADALRTRSGGYLLEVAEDEVDVSRFERAIASARLARSDGAAPDAVGSALRDALALWVGPPLADINGEPFVEGERRRLEELRLVATEDYFATELAGARHAEAVGELERMVDGYPLRERFWELLITALYRSGRQADALAAYQRVRRILAEELGIEPSVRLRDLERQVLMQDPELAAPSASPSPAPDRNDKSPAALVGSTTELATGQSTARHASKSGRLAGRRATVGIITVAVALSASLGLVIYRQVTADGKMAGNAQASGEAADGETAGNAQASGKAADGETAGSPEASGEERTETRGREVSIRTLQVGDCLNTLPGTDPQVQPGGVTEVAQTVLLVPCEVPHEQEVYHLFELAAGPYPGEDEAAALALEQCTTQFKNYVGVGPEWSGLDFIYVWPGQDQWEMGNRRGGCSLADATDRDLTGSMAGSRR